MSQGKYSPRCRHIELCDFKYNCYGKITEPFADGEYDSKVHFPNYDDEGFDMYGYSAFDGDGNFVGHGEGIDRLGYTERDYLGMSEDMFMTVYYG